MIAFFNSLFNYLILFFIFAALGGIGIVTGIFLRKKKDAKKIAEEAETTVVNE